MANETMKQVAVRMSPSLHRQTLTAAKKAGVTFGAFVRLSVANSIADLKAAQARWGKRTDEK